MVTVNFNEEMIGVLLPARLIPNGSSVKVKGDKVYTILDKLTFYVADSETREITAENGGRLIHDGPGNFTAINAETTLIWIIDTESFHEHIHHVLLPEDEQ